MVREEGVMGKLLTVFWIPISIAVTALAIASIIEHFSPGSVAWMAPFASALKLYSGFTQQMATPLSDTVHQYANIALPSWTPDAIVAYAASASGFTMGSTNFTSQEEQLHTLKSSAASVGWPLAILTFVFNAVRTQQISKFAGQHTILFVLYLAAVGAVLAGAVWGPGLLSHSA
jgi:hypothetical protein